MRVCIATLTTAQAKGRKRKLQTTMILKVGFWAELSAWCWSDLQNGFQLHVYVVTLSELSRFETNWNRKLLAPWLNVGFELIKKQFPRRCKWQEFLQLTQVIRIRKQLSVADFLSWLFELEAIGSRWGIESHKWELRLTAWKCFIPEAGWKFLK